MYEIHPLANIVAMANEHEQLALTEDIRKNGQREPAVLWNGKIVDGRCRQTACIALGIKLDTKELDSNLSEEEVAAVVKSLNTRRNLTDMQKAMSAFKAQEANWVTNEDIAKQWGIPLGTYKNARYIGVNKPEYVEPLFNGKSIKIFDPDKNREVTTNKINTLARIIKKTKEKEVVFVDNSEIISYTVDGLLKTEIGKEWYYNTKAVYDNSLDKDTLVYMLLTEMANLKFKVVNNE